MRKIFLAALTVIGLMVSCSQNEEIDTNKKVDLQPTPGGEVDFGISLGDVTRTVYGGEDIDDETGKPSSRFVGWTNGDIVSVFGTNVSKSFSNAKYQVVTSTGQDYADYLEHTGDYGVQWGDDVISDFISIYSPKCSTFDYTKSSTEYYYALNENEGNITFEQTTTAPSDEDKELLTSYAYTASASISNEQNIVFDGTETDDGTALKAYSIDTKLQEECMPNLIMYARTDRVIAGETVNLRYKPFTTVLNFQFNGYDLNNKESSPINTSGIFIQKITVEAPAGVNIAGDFKLNITGSQAKAKAELGEVSNGSNTITINTLMPDGKYLNLFPEQAINFNVFAIPNEYTMSTDKEWKLTFHTASYGTFTFSMKPAEKKTISAGKISKLPIPGMTFTNNITWDYTKWMTQIDEDVYLTELSVPGAWYCMDDEYQGTSIGLMADKLTYTRDANQSSGYKTTSSANSIDDGLENLFFNGVRAFNIDCRVTREKHSNSAWLSWPDANVWQDSHYDSGNYHFACSGTEVPDTYTLAVYNYWGIATEGVYVKKAVQDIINLAKAHPEEIIFIVFTYAEKPCTEKLGSEFIYGTVNPYYITKELNKVLTDSAIAPYLYTGITKDTTIDDVLSSGKNVVAKINHSNVNFATSTSPSFDIPTGIMTSFASMAMSGWVQTNVTNIFTDAYKGYYTEAQTYDIYNGKTANGMKYMFHQCQKTESSTTASGTENPSIFDRWNALEKTMETALTKYQDNTHDTFFQIGLGGSPVATADNLKPLFKTFIDNKLTANPSPVGWVLMNNALDETNGKPLVKALVEMNGKFYLNRKGGIDIGGGNGGGSSNPNQ